jgi:Tat protein translocase TatB subunit
MFGIGGQEIVIIGLLVLVIFGPSALPRMARDLGRFVSEARRSIDEFKEELTAGDDEEEDREKKGGERDL